MRVIIDRFEDNYAIVEKDEGEFYNIPHELVMDANEGDVIDILINKEETLKRKIEVSNLMNELFKD